MLQVHFEHTLCMACEWNLFNVRAPTSYISLFAGLPYCNPFSLQQASSFVAGHTVEAKLSPGWRQPQMLMLLGMLLGLTFYNTRQRSRTALGVAESSGFNRAGQQLL